MNTLSYHFSQQIKCRSDCANKVANRPTLWRKRHLTKNVSQHTPMSESKQEHSSPPVTHGDEHLSPDVTLLHCTHHKDSNSPAALPSQSQTTLTKTGENKSTITIPVLKDFFFLFSYPLQMAWGFSSTKGSDICSN